MIDEFKPASEQEHICVRLYYEYSTVPSTLFIPFNEESQPLLYKDKIFIFSFVCIW